MKDLKKKRVAPILCAVMLAVAVIVEAQQPAKIPRIGYLSGTSYSVNSARIEAFRQGLRNLGYRCPRECDSTGQPSNAKRDQPGRRCGRGAATNLEIQAPKDIEIAFRAASNERAQAVLVLQTPVLISQRRQVVDLAVKSQRPTIYARSEMVEDGGLMSYATSFTDLSGRAATYVDKILKGAKPADLPVEQPKKFEFIVNLKAAKQIGLTIPP